MERGSTCLVTGASGFIGRRLCAALAARVRVRALLRAPARGPWHDAAYGDLTAPLDDSITEAVHTVFHLAARTHAVDERDEDEALYRAVNVDGTRRLLESAQRSGVTRVVFMSSVKAIGEGDADSVIDDATPAAPATAYGRTKLEAEGLVLQGGFVPSAVVLRPCLVYGPGVKGNVERMIHAIDAGRFPPVPRTGNRRSMVHVDDVVRAAVAAAGSRAADGGCFIVSDGRAYDTRDLYEIICAALGRPARRGWPWWVFRLLAIAGDAVGRAASRRVPFDSDAFAKLFGSAAFDGDGLWRVLGTAPEWTLERAIGDIVARERGQ